MSYYLTIIGILRWIIELGRIDIINNVLLLSSHAALPREGHLDAAVHVMTHFAQRYNSRLVYGPSYPEIDHIVFKKCDWSEFYRDAKEVIPTNAPEPSGKEVGIQMFVDKDHAEDKVKSVLQIKELFMYMCEHCNGAVVLKETVYSRNISFWH